MTKEEQGERKRIAHSLDVLEAGIASMRLTLTEDVPLGLETSQTIMQAAGLIAIHAGAADAYRRAK